MSITNAVKMALDRKSIKYQELMQYLRVNSKQALSNKMTGERWSGADLVRVADLTGGKLAFVYPDGQIIHIEKAVEDAEK